MKTTLWYKDASCFHCGMKGHIATMCDVLKADKPQTPSGKKIWGEYIAKNPSVGSSTEYDPKVYKKTNKDNHTKKKKKKIRPPDEDDAADNAGGKDTDIKSDNCEINVSKNSIETNANTINSEEKEAKRELVKLIEEAGDIAYSLYTHSIVNGVSVKNVLIDQGCTHNCMSEYMVSKLERQSACKLVKIPLKNTYMTSSSNQQVPVPYAIIINLSVCNSKLYKVAFYVIQASIDSKNLSNDIIVGRQGLAQMGYYLINIVTGEIYNNKTKHVIIAESRKKDNNNNNNIAIVQDATTTNKDITTHNTCSDVGCVNTQAHNIDNNKLINNKPMVQLINNNNLDIDILQYANKLHNCNIQINEDLFNYNNNIKYCVVCKAAATQVCEDCNTTYFCSQACLDNSEHDCDSVNNNNINVNKSKIKNTNNQINTNNKNKKKQINSSTDLLIKQKQRQEQRYNHLCKWLTTQRDSNQINQSDADLIHTFIKTNIHTMALYDENEDDIKTSKEKELDKQFEINKQTLQTNLADIFKINKNINVCVPGSVDEDKLFNKLNEKIGVINSIHIDGLTQPTTTPVEIEDVLEDSIEDMHPAAIYPEVINTADYNKEKENKIKEMVEKQCSHLSSTQQQQVCVMLNKMKQAISLRGENMQCTTAATHEINTGNSQPFKEKCRPQTEYNEKVIDREIEKMLKMNIIKPSTSPYATNLLVVSKPDPSEVSGVKDRVCVAYVKLNNQTEKDVYPLPVIQQLFYLVCKAKWFTAMDLLSGFWQVAIKPEHRYKTAFITRRGLYEFLVMPFGLCNAPSTFQRMMDVVIKPEYREFVQTYIDDILIYSNTFEEHLVHVEKVFTQLIKYKLTVIKYNKRADELLASVKTKTKDVVVDNEDNVLLDNNNNTCVSCNLTYATAAEYYQHMLRYHDKHTTYTRIIPKILEVSNLHIQALQQSEKQFDCIYKSLNNNNYDKSKLTHYEQRMLNDNEFTVHSNGLLYHITSHNKTSNNVHLRLCIPTSLRTKIIEYVHSNILSTHAGVVHTLNKIQHYAWWPRLHSDVAQQVLQCSLCVRVKQQQKTAQLQPIQLPTYPWQIVSIDIVGPLPTTIDGNQYLLTMLDKYSKYAEAEPIPDMTAPTVCAAFIKKVVCRYGVPEVLVSDRGGAFISDIANCIYKTLNIKRVLTSAFHPQANAVERFHKSFNMLLRMWCDERQSDWDKLCEFALFAYNCEYHQTSKETPYYVNHARIPRTPINSIVPLANDRHKSIHEFVNILHDNITNTHKRIIELYDDINNKRINELNYNDKTITYNAGDKVYLYDSSIKADHKNKLSKRWLGPYTVIRRKSKVNYEIQLNNDIQQVHVNRLRGVIEVDSHYYDIDNYEQVMHAYSDDIHQYEHALQTLLLERELKQKQANILEKEKDNIIDNSYETDDTDHDILYYNAQLNPQQHFIPHDYVVAHKLKWVVKSNKVVQQSASVT